MLKTNAQPRVSEATEDTAIETYASPYLQVENTTNNKVNNAISNNGSIWENMPDVVCLSHLRWNFVYQRPQHLLSRFARLGRLFFVEEPVYTNTPEHYLHLEKKSEQLHVVTPHLPHGLSQEQIEQAQKTLLAELLNTHHIEEYLFWYYTPMALSFTEEFQPVLTVYDCMDELSAFKFAPARLKELEAKLFQKADLVFTGGQSLYEVKKEQHEQVYPFPSSIDKAHFAKAKAAQPDPADQAAIPQPRMGFFGVIDERMDTDLLAFVADAHPEWQLVIIGPVVKIDPASLPQRPNLHYLGGKTYEELPTYLSGWDVALLPFAINESTRFISPTKTPEYLAAGKPVVSTAIRDVVRPYGEENLVHIAHTPEAFVAGIEKALAQVEDKSWHRQVEAFLANMSWDQTWRQMVDIMNETLQQKSQQRRQN